MAYEATQAGYVPTLPPLKESKFRLMATGQKLEQKDRPQPANRLRSGEGSMAMVERPSPALARLLGRQRNDDDLVDNASDQASDAQADSDANIDDSQHASSEAAADAPAHARTGDQADTRPARGGIPALAAPASPRRSANAAAAASSMQTGSGSPSLNREQSDSRTTPPSRTTSQASVMLADGLAMLEAGRLVEGRKKLSQLLTAGAASLNASQAEAVRSRLAIVNEKLVFSRHMAANDPLVEIYTVKSGDLLSRIAPRYQITYQLIEQVNNRSANRIYPGLKLKLVKGPFHAVVSKADFRMDLYLADDAGDLIYIRSYKVGLGANDKTPAGSWLVRKGSKVTNPSWVNPLTYEKFSRDDPSNPIGEYWIGLEGVDDNTKLAEGYGIHGTIDPDSVGRMASMGCVRMLDDDVKWAFWLLIEGKSTVQIR